MPAHVANLDPDFCAATAAPNHDAPAGCGVLERVACEIAQDPIEHHGAAHDGGVGAHEPQIDALLPRLIVELARETLEQRLQPYRLGLDRVALLLNTQRIDQLIELLRQLCGRSLTAFEISPLGTGRQFLRRKLE